MFDDFLRARPSATAHRSGRSTSRPTTARTSTADPGSTAPAAFLALPRHRAARGRPRTTPPDAETVVRPGHAQERPRAGEDPHGRRGGLPRLGALPAAPSARPGCPPRCVSSSANAEQVLEVAGLSDAHRPPGRRRGRQGAGPAGQARPRHVPRRGGRPRRRPRPRPSSSRTRWPASRRAGRAASASWSASTASGRPTRCASTAPTSSCTTWRSCWRERARERRRRSVASQAEERDESRSRPPVHRRAVGACASRSSTSTRSARPSRCSRCPTGTSGCAATSTRASRTPLPGTYLNSFYELRPLPYAEGGYGYPESGQTIINVTNGKLIRLLVDDEPFDVRYGAAAPPRAGARPAGGHAHPRGRVGLARRPRGAGAQHAAWCRSPSGRSRRSATRSRRSTRPALLVVQSELVANEQLPARAEATPAWRRRCTDPLVSEQHRSARRRRAG